MSQPRWVSSEYGASWQKRDGDRTVAYHRVRNGKCGDESSFNCYLQGTHLGTTALPERDVRTALDGILMLARSGLDIDKVASGMAFVRSMKDENGNRKG